MNTKLRAVTFSIVLPRVITLIAVMVPLSATAFAMVQLWQRQFVPVDLVLLVGLYLLTGFGITVGFHRFATHRSFKSNPVVEFILLALGTMAVEGQVLQWVATHWKHHRLADKPGDPHSPLQGLFHAHIGWMFDPTAQGDPERDAKHLIDDPIAVFIHRTFLVWIALGFVIPFLVDGWRGLLWGGLVRVFLTHHITWSVNSICHQFGRRAFDTPDESRNEWVVGVLGLGEGWHNNHHAFPESAYHGLRWYEIDLSGYLIRGLAKARLISGVRRPTAERIERRRYRQAAASITNARQGKGTSVEGLGGVAGVAGDELGGSLVLEPAQTVPVILRSTADA